MTADRRDGSDDHGFDDRRASAFGLSRRRLLAGIGGVGAVGMASGAGTFAYLSDREDFPRNTLGSGAVDVDVACSQPTDCTGSDGLVRFAIDGLDRGSSGTRTVTATVRTNPARLWLATVCPDPDLAASDPLGDALGVELVVGSDPEPTFSGSLSALRRKFVTGLRIDDRTDAGEPCLDPKAELDLTLNWTLPADAPDAAAGRTTAVELRLYAEQCRHVSEDEATGSNPFADLDPCPEPSCAVCEEGSDVRIRSLTLRYLGSAPATVVATAAGAGSGGTGTGGTVLFDGTVRPQETFLLDAASGGSSRLGPNVFVDDGSGTDDATTDDDSSEGRGGKPSGSPGRGTDRPDGVAIDTSCSVPLAPGDQYGNFAIVGGTTTDGAVLCGSETNR